jgi:hypothetical protein
LYLGAGLLSSLGSGYRHCGLALTPLSHILEARATPINTPDNRPEKIQMGFASDLKLLYKGTINREKKQPVE